MGWTVQGESQMRLPLFVATVSPAESDTPGMPCYRAGRVAL